MAKHMSQKQKNEFNEIFLRMEKELREKKFRRPASKQVKRERRWKERKQLRDAALINHIRAKRGTPGTASSALPGVGVASAVITSSFGPFDSSSSSLVLSSEQTMTPFANGTSRGFSASPSGAASRAQTSHSRHSRASSVGAARPMSHREWKKTQKPNKFLQNRVVVDRFAKHEDPAEVAARQKQENTTAAFNPKDQPFQDVLDACWPEAATKLSAVEALKRLFRPRGSSRSGGRGGKHLSRPLRPQGIESGKKTKQDGQPVPFSVDDVVNSHGYTLLGQAVVDKNEGAIDFLIEVKADLGYHDTNGLAPLHIAALENSVRIAKQLLRAKADPSQFAFGVCAGKSPLGTALSAGSKDVAEYLQALETKMAKVPQSYAQRYLRMKRIVPVEVSGLNAARALRLEEGLSTALPRQPICRSFLGTDKFFEAEEAERQRRRLASSNFRFNRRVQFLQQVEEIERRRLKKVKQALASSGFD